MEQLSRLRVEIETLRNHLHKLIVEKEDLLDRDIIEISKKLDLVLREYYELIIHKENMKG